MIAWLKELFTRQRGLKRYKSKRFKSKRWLDLPYNPFCAMDLYNIPRRESDEDMNLEILERIRRNENILTIHEELEADDACGGIGKCVCAPWTRQLLEELDKLTAYRFEEGDFHGRGPGEHGGEDERDRRQDRPPDRL